jgi:small-conductance mechanosensitive channel
LGTLVLSAVTEFVLDREVFPRLQLRPGVGYAIATFTRWVILIVGTLLALAALGIDTTKLTLVAGALSVGIGFGLQHVVNNFASGLILIVERPVSVGDLVEIGPLIGEIRRIGIRSSSLRTMQGAEVVVPNSDLTSNQVVNWTRSDRQRRYDIDVSVADGAQPEQVMLLLVEAAREVSEIMTDPPPLAVFNGFSASSMNFKLLAWVKSIDLGLQAQNSLRVAILRKLDSAGIAKAAA